MEGSAPSCTVEVPSFPSPTRLPVNGFDGSLHDVIFFAPSYRVDPYFDDPFSTPLTWKVIDIYGSRAVVWGMTQGICLGMMLITLLFVLFVTPQAKRWKPFHSCLLLALLFKTSHLLATCVQASSLTVGFNPAYRFISKDYTQIISSTFVASTIVRALLDLVATSLTFACLFVQSRASLAGLRLSHRPWYLALTTYLVLASVACIFARILSLAGQIFTFYSDRDLPTAFDLTAANSAAMITYSLTCASYCLVAFASVLYVLWTRRKLLMHGGRSGRYDRALSLLALVLLESFAAPLILAIAMALSSISTWFLNANVLLLPSILALLPFGGLFSGAGKPESDARTRATPGQNDLQLEQR